MEPPERDRRRMYGDLAWTWPIISPPEDYVEEAGHARDVIREHSLIEARTLLDLGCGGGHNDCTLKKSFQVTGVDLSPAMLDLARRLNPEVAHVLGDMRTTRLGKTFDAVTIFDSVNYMRTETELEAALATAFHHLRPGGVFYTYVEASRESFQQNKTTFTTHRKGDVGIVLAEHDHDPDPKDTTYESTFVYFIEEGGELRVATDNQVLGLFPLEAWPRIAKKVGFEVLRFGVAAIAKPEDRYPELVCRKPLA